MGRTSADGSTSPKSAISLQMQQKKHLVENVTRDSQEEMLSDFVKRVENIQRELMWQDYLGGRQVLPGVPLHVVSVATLFKPAKPAAGN